MKSDNKIIKFLNGKGFYAVMGVCLIALGITAFAVTSSIPKVPTDIVENESMTSIIIETEEPKEEAPVAGVASGIKAENNSSKSQEISSKEEQQEVVAKFFTLPVTGEILKAYSESELLYSKTYGDMRLHLGLDIKAEAGTAVKSSGDGTVLGIAEDPLYGTMVTIDHGNGITGLYCGLAKEVAVKKGQTVKSGDNIGAIGVVPSESSDEAHLHLAFKENDKYVSPLSLINLGS